MGISHIRHLGLQELVKVFYVDEIGLGSKGWDSITHVGRRWRGGIKAGYGWGCLGLYCLRIA